MPARTDIVRALPPLLLDWYREHRRRLPWRGTRDPYAIWVSEVMLQQTQVSTVIPYYQRWMQRFPDVRALARANTDEVLSVWQGLGYYSRAKSLLEGARAVVDRYRGHLPASTQELRQLPSIGPYSAGAIASIAFNQPAALVDGNVTRVLCRMFGLRGDPARAPLKNRLWELAGALIPEGRARDFNQALMELGATVCTPKKPRCTDCPGRRCCVAYRRGLVERLPDSRRHPKLRAVRMAAALVRDRGRVLVVKLLDDAPRWASMWQFPTAELGASETGTEGALRAAREAAGIAVTKPVAAAMVRHSVTRYRIELEAFFCKRQRGRARALSVDQVAWKLPADLAALAMPAAHRKLCTLLLSGGRPRP